MNYALNVVRNLPENTQIWCGHEYTVSNLDFALSVDPNNIHLQEKMKWSKEQRANKKPTVPSTIMEEKLYNPFMRVSDAVLKKSVGSVSDWDEDTMMKLREAKNSFKSRM